VMLLRPSLIEDAATFAGRDPAGLAGSMTVEVVEDSSVLRIRVEDQDRDRARRTAAFVGERYVGIADQFAPASNVGRVGIVSPPAVLDEPTGPQPLRAAAAGLLVGVVLVVVFLALPRVRHQHAQHPAP
jgi:capsular polysaccharide biosynthesis protein